MSRTEVTFTVYGKPVPEGSMKAIPVRLKNGKWSANIMHSKSKELMAYRKAIANVADRFHDEMYSENEEIGYSVFAIFYVPRPKTVKRILPTTRPDCDKYLRSVGDALTTNPAKHIKGFFKDDSQIIDIHGQKFYCNEEHPAPCTVIRVRKILLASQLAENIDITQDSDAYIPAVEN